MSDRIVANGRDIHRMIDLHLKPVLVFFFLIATVFYLSKILKIVFLGCLASFVLFIAELTS